MSDLPVSRLVESALRCYPAHWRRRHAEEAAELAALLMRDGTPALAIAWSYLAGAAREWLTPRPGRRLSTVACALLVTVCSLGAAVAVLASTEPARAASPGQPGRPAHCAPASSHPQPITTEPGHGRAC
jgi:hypothetical protein